MKLHISQEQLNELSDIGKEKLMEWCSVNYKDPINCSSKEALTGTHGVEKCEWCMLPLLSISELIECLEKYGVFYDLYGPQHARLTNQLSGWKLWYWPTKDIKQEQSYQENNEPCDVLWLAIKGVLEK